MRVRAGEVRRLKTNDVVLVTAVNGNYVKVAPYVGDSPYMVGRYLEFKGVQFALDYAVAINPVLLGEYISSVPMGVNPKIGRDAPGKFRFVHDIMQMLSYIDSQEDINMVLKARARG